MIDVLASGGMVCALCAAWIKSYKNNKLFNSQVKVTHNMLDKFISINGLECMDFELENILNTPDIKKKYIDTTIIKQIGKELDTGYDFFHIRAKAGYNTLKHRHNFSDIFLYIISGKLNISYNDQPDKIIQSGNYIHINKSKFHCLIANQDVDFIMIAKPPIIVKK